ncbi:GNAT family N-acetyltransferase [Providencia rettgeri]|uniref:GNAT family N-acetyltransferase n=1 Tax=Providencia rettgeri TaxID=587 RepID=A0AAP2K2W8_PRORE|nr:MULTISPECIES: GNAT family N-acetyltransferase [Providencia]MBX6952013.1 GNAT family N-acetyltransferase [Providencia rettgeri]MBX6955678.1 GNAT family N-acetyltransferase [Providencia rettgeri]MBX6961098.1 GNAT family N-acetyltransferase [Providencia rettgeri]MBX6973846.1 GNAT family N-acetyltransferase [Providencia rettgeri]MBX6982733.1 GNAT family N-acetyltransferase [Providencia rettgeri]
MNINFRLTTSHDVSAIFLIDTVATPERLLEITQWVKQNACFVLEANDEILAYGVLTHHFYSHGFIELLMVNNKYRRQGFGHILINKLKEQSKTDKIFTSTNQSNLATQKFLEKTGFVPSGYIDNLDDNDPELIYYYNRVKTI